MGVKAVDAGGRPIGPGHPCLVIAEVGINHNGDIDLALRMIEAIAAAGAECVKFQTFSAEEFVNDPDDTYTYSSQGAEVTESMLEMFKRVELPRSAFARLFDAARAAGLIPFSTPTDREAVHLLEELGVEMYKIGSDDLVYTPFLEYVADKGKPIVLSAGMASGDDVARAIDTIRARGNQQIVLLHCVSEYPTPLGHANLRKIPALAERFGIPVGFSDHTAGSRAASWAVAMGACVVEKHFTLDHGLPGPDHHFSADPGEMADLVAAVRDVELALGDPTLEPTDAEREMAALCHRSIVLVRDVAAGERLAFEDLAFRRPGTGMPPYRVTDVVGRRTRTALAAGTMLADDLLVST